MSENVRLAAADRRNEPMQNSLNELQKAAIEMLAIGGSLPGACEALKIDPRTLYRWRKNRSFARALDKRRAEIWSSAADQLRALLCPAVEVLQQQLADSYDPNRYRAANAILRIGGVGKGVVPKQPQRSKRVA
jgi:hypothetical protein